jgi:hypothetical protein
MSVTGPDGWAELVPAWCTPHEALTRTRAAVGSTHRASGPNPRIVIISELGRFGGPIGSRAVAPVRFTTTLPQTTTWTRRIWLPLSLAAVQGLDRLGNHSAEHDSPQPSARQEFAHRSALVCRPPPKASTLGAAGAVTLPCRGCRTSRWLARCGIRYLLRFVLRGDVVDRRSPIGETVPGSAAGPDGQGE